MKAFAAATLAAFALATPCARAASTPPLTGAPAPTAAGSHAVGDCVVRAATDADRKALVRWVFVAFAQHPDLAEVIGVDPAVRATAENDVGERLERLLAHDRISEFKASIGRGGDDQVAEAFGRIGEMAFEGIDRDPAVQKELASTLARVDMARITDALMRP